MHCLLALVLLPTIYIFTATVSLFLYLSVLSIILSVIDML